MCNIVSEYWTVTQPIEVYKLCRKENRGKELRSEWVPEERSSGNLENKTGHGKDILYRHIDDIGKRLLVTDEVPGFCVFASLAELEHWSYCRSFLKGVIPIGANVCRIDLGGYATNMLKINCNDPWPGENE